MSFVMDDLGSARIQGNDVAMDAAGGAPISTSRQRAGPTESRIGVRGEFEALGLLFGILGVILLLALTVGSTAHAGW